MRKVNYLTLSLTIGILCTLFSCGEKAKYIKYQDINKAQWAYTDTLEFPINTISQELPITLLIRNTDQYGFQNIWVDVVQYQNGKRVDSLRQQVMLADAAGRWLGKKSGAIYTQEKELNLNNVSDSSVIKITQAMRENPLPGIQAVGIKMN